MREMIEFAPIIQNPETYSLFFFGLAMAFSMKTRNIIRDRARAANGGVLASEISGRTDMPLEAAHLNHDRDYEGYDDPENGLYVTIDEHLTDPLVGHLSYRKGRVNVEGKLKNGLTPAQNDWAIQEKRKDVMYAEANQAVDFFRKHPTGGVLHTGAGK